MKQKYTVFFPFSFEEIDAFDDNVDVCIVFDTGEEDTLLFGTPKNKKRFPDVDMVLVHKLTQKRIIRKVKKIMAPKSLERIETIQERWHRIANY
jgi:hypothetical protein